MKCYTDKPITNEIINIIIEEASQLRCVEVRVYGNTLVVEHDTCTVMFSDSYITVRTTYPGTSKSSDWYTLQYEQYTNLRDIIVQYSSQSDVFI